MDASLIVSKELIIPQKYIKITSRQDRVLAVVHRLWLKSLLRSHQLLDFILHETLNEDEVAVSLHQAEEFEPWWQKIFIRVFKKETDEVFSLPRTRVESIRSENPLSYTQLLAYISQTNYKNLWKDIFKKHQNIYTNGASSEHESKHHLQVVDHDSVMREIITRVYGCPIINLNLNRAEVNASSKNSRIFEVHSNVLPALCAIETEHYFLLVQQPFIGHSLQDCVTFSPAILSISHLKPLFIIYQLLHAMRCLHDRGLVMGDITLSDVLVTDNFWIKVIPQFTRNIHSTARNKVDDFSEGNFSSKKGDQNKRNKISKSKICKNCYSRINVSHRQEIPRETPNKYCSVCSESDISPEDTKSEMINEQKVLQNERLNFSDPQHISANNLERLCELWAKGQLTNFKYLMALNQLAGRRFGDPTCHYVMPWVTDFTLRSGGNWRDLTRSKFRLNKGDRQLDLTYDTAPGSSQVPHHVSDVLSEITYYVYMARRTPQSVLCKYVRTKWVPAEYPSSIQRLQEWTPDECIPEFFIDPMVFKSVHEDLPDLEVPPWASSTQDFIQKHQEALESCYVSERLHHWIDLTFGYKLSGSAAIKSKNVCLQMVDSHTSLRNTGVVQLFVQPHPQRLGFSPYWSILAPKIQPIRKEKRKTGERSSEDEGHSSGFEEEDQGTSPNLSRSSPLALSRLLSRSRGSLLPPFGVLEEKDRIEQKPSSSAVNGGSTIVLPRDCNPISALQNVESLYGFLGRTFCHKTHNTSKHSDHHSKDEHKKYITHSRSLDMKVLGCLTVELLMAPKLRAFGNQTYLSFEERLHACRSVLAYSSESLPRYARYAVSLLLQMEINSGFSILDSSLISQGKVSNQNNQLYVVTDKGLPPPSAHQLLQPLLCSAVFPFPRFFTGVYSLLQKFQDYTLITRELKFLNSLNTNLTKDIVSDSSIKIALFNSKVGEIKVKTACEDLAVLLPEIQASGSHEILNLILPYIKELLEDSCTSISAAWYLFDPVSKVLGPHKTCSVLLDSIVKLYEYGSDDVCVSGSGNKHVKLYHRSFLLQLIIRLGLKTFLENFITPLVEAVGGYREVNSTEHGFTQQQAEFRSKTSNLKSCDLEEVAPVGTLSPLDEDSSGDSENKPCNSEDDIKKPIDQDNDADLEPEVFVFESEDPGRQSPTGDSDAPLYNLMDHLDLNLPQPSGDGDDNASLELPGDEETLEPEDVEEASDLIDTYQTGKETEQVSNLNSETVPSDDIQSSEVSSKLPEDDTAKDPSNERAKKPMGQYKVSDMSADSLLWLSHRLGPVLTSRHLSRNLLRMLTLCYLGKENLNPLSSLCSTENLNSCDVLNIANGNVVGDKNAQKVLECLTSIAGLYGEQLIVLQYLPHMGELIALCKRKLTANLEGGLVGCLALLRYIIPYLSDATLMDQLQDVILKTILNPAVRLVSTTRFIFPSGYLARAAVASKFVDAVYILALRIGCEMTRKNLAIPSLQRFFLAFDKAHGRKKNDDVNLLSRSVDSKKESPNISKSLEDNFLEIRRDGSTAEWTVKGTPLQITHARLRDSDSADSYSPPLGMGSEADHDQTRNQAIEELKCTFTPELAHKSYVSFLRFLGEQVMEQSLKNEDFIKDLCFEYEQERQQSCTSGGPVNLQYLSDYLTPTCQADFDRGSGSFGSNVSVVGNRIDLQRVDVPSVIPPSSSENFMALISRKMENTKRHLRGNWLAYWEHEIGRAEKDTRFNFKQIKLQTFSGHSNSVRMIQALDNENSFISGSRDKTVKLWSLRSEGDGSSVSHCQWTYTGHRKSVMAISFLESLRLAASCDSVVHLWDPFIGGVCGQLDSSRSPPINVLKAMPPPSTCLLASTTDATLRILDGRTCSFVNELKVSMNPAGLIRCIAVGPEGYWIAVGQSSGTLTILDIRTGLIMSSWKGHEGEVLQLVAANNNCVISSSLDQTVSAWNILDGKLNFHMKGPSEPVHCLNCYNSELISGTTASRIGVHTAIDAEASFSSTRLRSDTFKGVLTAMAVLPLNRLLLLGSDNGNISLLC